MEKFCQKCWGRPLCEMMSWVINLVITSFLNCPDTPEYLPPEQTQRATFANTKYLHINRDSTKIMISGSTTHSWAPRLDVFEAMYLFRMKIGQSEEWLQGFKATVPIYVHCPYLCSGLYKA